MSFNPFNEKAEKLDNLYVSLAKMCAKPYDKRTVDPYTRLRCILTNGAEYEAVRFSHAFHRVESDNDVRRALSASRRQEQEQQKRIACLKPIDETILETTIGYEHLAVDLTAILANGEQDKYVKSALDFALLEDFDHLYRYADLLDFEHGIKAERIISRYAEIMPARPTIAEHRAPQDDVKKAVNYKKATGATKLHIGIIVAAEQQTMNYYMNQGAFYTSELGRALYGEIAMIEEQHVTHYGSLIDTKTDRYEELLNHEYAECYLYYSCYMDETDARIKKLWEENLQIEIAHLHAARELLEKKRGKEWQQVIKEGAFPELLAFKPQIEYVRKVIADTVRMTAKGEGYICVDELKADDDFFAYQEKVVVKPDKVASHNVIKTYIESRGEDYRYETAPHPIEELRQRTKDNVKIARTPSLGDKPQGKAKRQSLTKNSAASDKNASGGAKSAAAKGSQKTTAKKKS